jgi:SAM-dependent methyltransferase
MADAIYINGSYLETHPSWHIEDAEWKAQKVLSIIHRNQLSPTTIVDAGCGAGRVLSCLQNEMPDHCMFTGFDISPQAVSMCQEHANERLRFVLQRPDAEAHQGADLVISLDVLEHTEDYLSYLRSLRRMARHCILHVPLDLSLLSLACGMPERVRKSAGHLHYFTSKILMCAMEECGYHVLDAMYTRPAIERPAPTLRCRLARLPRLAAAWISEEFAALTLGGFSLMVLAERRSN